MASGEVAAFVPGHSFPSLTLTRFRMTPFRFPPLVLSCFIVAGCATPADAPMSTSADSRVSAPSIAFLNSPQLPPGLPFSEGVRVGDLVLLSGQIGNVPGELKVVPGGLEAESRQTMDNIRRTLEVHHLEMDDIVKCTVMLTDMSQWPAFNEIYRTYFVAPYPARSAVGANGLAIGARVEVECIAAVGAAAAKRALSAGNDSSP